MVDDFGFGGKKMDLSVFKPKEAALPAPGEEHIADRVAEKAGFSSREPIERVRRVRKMAEPMDTAFVRAPIHVINRLKSYCNERDLSYGEALEELMRKAGL